MTSVEYDDIYNLTMEKNIYNNDDEYNKLINKETVVLDTLNRIVDQKEEEKRKKGMVDAPINIVVYKVFKTIEMICRELYKRKPIHLIFNKERQLYIGMFVVFCSVCFIILYKGS
tara:strand:- start:135 stop:479 length:345 start_codon:yes stop_codon:yes gene_type:complete